MAWLERKRLNRRREIRAFLEGGPPTRRFRSYYDLTTGADAVRLLRVPDMTDSCLSS